MIADNIVLILFLILIVYFLYYQFFKSKQVLKNWAADNGTIIVKKELRFIRVGPFFYHKDRAVYRILVRRPDGELQKAWVLVGSLLFLYPNKIEVIWDASFSKKHNRIINIKHSATALFYFAGILLLIVLVGMLLLDINFHEFLTDVFQKWD